MSNLKVALLYYGQPRLKSGFTINFDSIKTLVDKQLNDNDGFLDVFIHCWYSSEIKTYDVSAWAKSEENREVDHTIIEFIRKHYTPKDMIIEEPKKFDKSHYHTDTKFIGPEYGQKWNENEISNMISQIYSVEQVCKLVEKYGEYDVYILSRFDIITDYIPDLFEVDNNTMFRCTDFIQIFGKNTLKVYSELFSNTKNITYSYINAEYLRYYPLSKKGINIADSVKATLVRNNMQYCPIISNLNSNSLNVFYVTYYGLAIMKLGNNHFRVIKHNLGNIPFQWIGNHHPLGKQNIKFSIKFSSEIPKANSETGTKVHCPDVYLNDWIKDVQSLDKWYNIDISYDLTDPLVIYLYLDNYMGFLDFEIII